MLGKKSSQKIAKTRFLYSQEYRDQKLWGKNARNNFSRNTRIVRAKKCWEKNRLKKVRKHVFIFTLIRDQKMGGGKARNNFSRKTRIMPAKKVGGKIVSKNCIKHVFYIHTNIVTKKWGEKKRETIFPETHE